MRQIDSSATHMTPFSFGTSVPSLDEDQTALWSPTAGNVQPGSGIISEWNTGFQRQYGTSHSFPETTTPGFECGPVSLHSLLRYERSLIFCFGSVPQEVDWDPTAALWGTPEGAVEKDSDLTHPVSTHSLQWIADRA